MSLSGRNRFFVGYLVIVTGLLFAAFARWAYDDPFITYRYAGNLARGLGLVYNPGERVLSTTTPLFAILLAGLSYFRLDLPAMANLVGAFSIALGGLFLWDLARSWEVEAAGWAALALYPTFTLLLSTLGSESPLYLAFCLGSFAFFARRNFLLTAVFAALALLTRGDGALVAVILGMAYLARLRGPIPWRAVLLFLGMTLPWFAFAWAYYGSPLPVTLAAKQSQGSMAISQRFAEGFVALAQGHLAFWEFRVEALLAAAGLVYAILRERRWLVFFSWMGLYFIAFTALGVSRYYWYYAPLVPGFVIAVGLGVEALGWVGKAALERRKTNPGRLAFPAYTIWIVPGLLLFLLALAQIQNVFDLHAGTDRRYGIYRQVGEWLSQNTPPASSVGALEVGIIGYYAQRPVVDFAGLLQPEVAARLTPHTTYEDAAIWAVQRYRPAYLVLHDRLFPRLEGGYVMQHCRPVQKFEGKPYGYSLDMVIYGCP